MSAANRYERIIESIFFKRYKEGSAEVPFRREDIVDAAKKLKIKLPKNLGDVIYSFRYRGELPKSVKAKAPKGQDWVIRPKGRAQYAFVASHQVTIKPNSLLAETKIPDATPGVISMYALSDEQALLAIVRYNRLIDIFTGITCYSLQSHLRTSIPGIGQVETDEIYVGIDQRGSHYVFPVQAKGGRDSLGIIQIEQDFALCSHKYPDLICIPIAAQFMDDDVIAMFSFEESSNGIKVSNEKHYILGEAEEVTKSDLDAYKKRIE